MPVFLEASADVRLKLSGGQCLTKNIIEDLLLYTIMDERFEAGYAAALSDQEQPF